MTVTVNSPDSKQNSWRVLIVEDEVAAWAKPMEELLKDHAEMASRNVEIELAPNAEIARSKLLRRHFHLISMDMLMPDKFGELQVKAGINLAQIAAKSGALTSKLLVYSALLDPETRNPAGMQVHAELPKLDRYAKGSLGSARHSGGIVSLTQGEWAQRVLRYLDGDNLTVDFGDGDVRPSVIGTWLECAVKHLPPLLAAHAQELLNWWDGGTAVSRRVDAATTFMEICSRLALTQTLVLLTASGVSRQRLSVPANANVAACLDALTVLLKDQAETLKRFSWWSCIHAALPGLQTARLVRNAVRHNLQPGAAHAAWQQLRGPLQSAMDMTAYWALHPIWVDLRRGSEGWAGERLAGNGFPRPRRPVARDVDFPDVASSGGPWQTAVDVSSREPRLLFVRWDDWLVPDVNRRAWWLKAYSGQRGVMQCIDLDSGAVQGHADRY